MTDTSTALEPVEDVPTHDEKGRPFPAHMSERDMLTELLLHMRQIADVVEDLSDSPMVKALQGGGSPLMAMFRS